MNSIITTTYTLAPHEIDSLTGIVSSAQLLLGIAEDRLHLAGEATTEYKVRLAINMLHSVTAQLDDLHEQAQLRFPF